MRPIASEQDPLRYPLNTLFGTQAHVRLLRVMANEVDGPLTVSDIAERAGLTIPGAKKALERLLQSGFIARVGGGKKYQYEIRSSDRLMIMMIGLFRTEKDRYEKLLTVIKKEIKNLMPPPHAAWIQFPYRESSQPLTIGVLHETLQLTNVVRQLRDRLNQVERDFDLTIELEGYTKADIPALKPVDVTVLYGIMPNPEVPARRQSKKLLIHKEKDRHLQIMSENLAKAIEQDASLVRRAKDHIDRLLEENQGMAAKDLIEWRDILAMYSIPRLAQFLVSSSERANRLRQSNPFLAILNIDDVPT